MEKENKVAHLGWCVASYSPNGGQRLTILKPSDTTGDYFDPAESVSMYSPKSIKALRDFLVSLDLEGGI